MSSVSHRTTPCDRWSPFISAKRYRANCLPWENKTNDPQGWSSSCRPFCTVGWEIRQKDRLDEQANKLVCMCEQYMSKELYAQKFFKRRCSKEAGIWKYVGNGVCHGALRLVLRGNHAPCKKVVHFHD